MYASNMKTISSRVLILIAATMKHQVCVGDINKTYFYAKNAIP